MLDARVTPTLRERADTWLRPVGWASLVANVVLVVSGGAVRLTGSGLGCPTWPRCTDDSFVPHRALGIYGVIEFSNRMLGFVLAVVAIATFVVVWRSDRRDLRMLALALALGVPAQAVIGGISVLSDLNPWVVSLHLLVSLAMIGLATLFLWRLAHPAAAMRADRTVARLGWATFGAGWVVLYLGTVVTGSGPHAGDATAPRNGLSSLQTSQLHADLVFLFVGLTVGLLFVLHATHGPARAIRAARVLLVVELGQGTIGFVQYFTDVPIVLVGFHLLGAAIISATLTWALLETRAEPARTST